MPMLVSAGVAFATLAAAFGIAIAVAYLPLSDLVQGAAISSVAAAYYVAVILDANIQLWAMRKADADASPQGPAPGRTLEQSCMELARTFALSPREREILVYLARGYNSGYIASALAISDSTVRTHTRRIYDKLGVSSRMELLDLVNRANG